MTEQQEVTGSPTREQIAKAIWDALPFEVEDVILSTDADDAADAVLALFSQPTPSAESVWSVVLVKRGGHYRYVKVIGGDWDGALESAENANEGWEALQGGPFVRGNGVAYHSTITAAPTSIEDMTPGTTFRITEDEDDEIWTVQDNRVAVCSAHGVGRYLDVFDPSTIRGVTPPRAD